MHPYFSLAGRTALVTGGTRGIGLMIAKAFVEAGAHVYVCARDGEACAQTAAELSQLGQCTGIAANLASEEGVQALARELGERIQRLDILVNNAGTTWGAPLESYPAKGWEKVMQLNVTSVFGCIQQMLPLLREAGSAACPARVINIGSVAGMKTERLSAYSYAASKAAVHMMTRDLAGDLAARNITVNAIAPGFIETDMTAQMKEQVKDQLKAGIPLKRLGTVEDIAGGVLFLASKDAGYITGHVLNINGGMYM